MSVQQAGKCLITSVVLSLVVTVFWPGTSAEAAENYIRLNEYLSAHPGQRSLMSAFSREVRAPAQPVSHPPERPVRVAIIYPGLQASDYWRRSQRSFEVRMQELHIPYQLKSYFSRPSVDAKLQNAQLLKALQWHPDYLVFTLDIAPQSRMIERLLTQKRPKLILQNITTPLVRWQSHQPFLYVGFDHASGTRLMADWMLKKIHHRGKYLMLYFSPGYVSQMRGDTFAAEAARYPDVKQVAAYYTDGNEDKAYKATLKTLKEHPDLKMIFACSTDVALGALRALRETKRQDVLLNGWGGGDAELKELQNKGLDVTVMRMNDDNGIAMAEAIKLDQTHRSSAVPQVFAGDIKLLNSGTSATEIRKLKQYAFRLSSAPVDASK